MSEDNNMTRESAEAILVRLRTRQRRLNAIHAVADGLLVGAIAAIAAATAGILAGVESVWPAALLVPAGGVAGALIGLLLPIDTMRIARALDRAAASDDRFASALQLASHAHPERVRMLAEDALRHVGGTSATAALPARLPRSGRWLAAPLAALLVLLWLAPVPSLEAAQPVAEEISADEWSELERAFKEELRKLPAPAAPEEEDLQARLERLGELLAQKPEKKDALAEIARLRSKIDEMRKQLKDADVSMKDAAHAMAKSKALEQFAALLKQGEYEKASEELKKLADAMKEGQMHPSAEEFENMAADMERLATELADAEELAAACEQAAGAAGEMNRQSLAEAMQSLAQALQQSSSNLRRSDQLRRSDNLLEQLQRMMNESSECEGCAEGCASCQGGGQRFVLGPGQQQGGGRGGLQAGRGTMENWQDGALAENDEERAPDTVNAAEQPGTSDAYRVVSPRERARSGQSYAEIYAEFVQKTEADLDLESVPLAYREYLRRYFRGIQPPDDASEPDAE